MQTQIHTLTFPESCDQMCGVCEMQPAHEHTAQNVYQHFDLCCKSLKLGQL